MRRVPDVPCPNCGLVPVESRSFGDPAPRYVPACSCYPDPHRRCVCCHAVLDDEDRCHGLFCPIPYVRQPLPDVDPQWRKVEHFARQMEQRYAWAAQVDYGVR